MKSADYFALHPIFTAAEFSEAREWSNTRGKSDRTLEALLRHHVEAGHLVRLRRGLYAVIPEGKRQEDVAVDRVLVASKLSPSSVIALHAALEFHGLATSAIDPVHFRSRERLRPATVDGCRYMPIATDAGFFDDPDEERSATYFHRGASVRVTTKQRTIAEIFDAPEQSGGWEELAQALFRAGQLDWEVVIHHADESSTSVGSARLGLFLEAWQERLGVTQHHLAALRALSPRQPRYLEPEHRPGKLIAGWNLVVPEQVSRLLARRSAG
ncbi:MAG: type IV toxin-antitoxin system AbiEi family antitoxin domain-containing protein [Deltaproteobacteria bacterium]|nr:type IV toxin-antitoxin system AbiEi family antitoxin domain-containing protein [Deltaproteobacteria bacterium]